jgi:hypothetical protein
MRFNIDKSINDYTQEPVIGNVYNVRGGSGARKGYMFVIVAITECKHTVTTITISKEGEIVCGSNYGYHYFADKCPIAYVKGLEDLTFTVEVLNDKTN